MKPQTSLVGLLLIFAGVTAQAQVCPAGSAAATFDWEPVSTHAWASSNQNTGDSQIYVVNYTDNAGAANTLSVTLTLDDPDGRNCDDNFDPTAGTAEWPSDPTCVANFGNTETDGFYGIPYLTAAMKSLDSDELVGFEFAFSKPVVLAEFSVGDVDDTDVEANNEGESFQDELDFVASLGGTDVSLTVTGGSNITVNGQSALAILEAGVAGGLDPGDVAGTAIVSSAAVLDSFTIEYSNGPDDDGVSDSHLIRLNGFTFCVVDVLPSLAVTKTANPPGLVGPGDTITYTVAVTNSGLALATGVSLTDTLPAGVTYTAESTAADGATQATPVVEDFEAGIGGWSVPAAPASTCTTGAFVVGDPNGVTTGGVVTQADDDHTAAGTDALFTVANTGAGTVDVDGGVCVIESPVFPVTGEADLSIWYFFGQRDAGDDAGDFFLLELSTDAGASYTDLVNLGDVVSNAAWTRATARVAAGSDIRLRAQVSDGPLDGDLIEAGLDDLLITSVVDSTKDNDSSNGTADDLSDGAVPALVTAGDDFVIPAGETLSVTFEVTVDTPPPAGESVTNVAAALADGLTTPVEGSATNPLDVANVSVEKQLTTPPPFQPGQTVQYAIQVSNAGPAAADNVTVSDVPAGLTNAVITNPGVCDVSIGPGNTFPCVISSLADSASTTVNVQAEVQ